MANIFESIGRKIDDDLMKSYNLGDTIPSQNTHPSLTLDILKANLYSIIDKGKEYTRGFWRDFANKYNPKYIFVVVHPNTLAVVEQEGGLYADARPSWLRVSENCVLGTDFYVCECSCLCHDPHLSMTRRLLPTGEWCCQCSKYEDVT